ncbi:MAG: tRNA 2-thiouridine(34) synthase MnmA [Phycisphaerales bacterium]|jgi:tRNA-specific 2-thiouridylase
MDTKGKRVCVALSGGVDSSTAAAILLERGYNCFGAFIISCEQAAESSIKARKIADELGIELHILDLQKDFEQILEYFCSEYKRGRTPNPCVYCNRFIKFGKLLSFAQSKGADYLATGHYAKIIKNKNQQWLYAADTVKDQSYALAMIRRDVLEHLLLPLGDYDKEQIREMAKQLKLSSAKREESQEICFIPDDDYAAALEQRCPEVARQGKIVNSKGNILGQHNGVHKFTIGQRRGLRVAMGVPYYVVGLDAETNTVILGPKEELMHRRLSASEVNWLIDEPHKPFCATVKTRYNDNGKVAKVYPKSDVVEIEFDELVAAITPGQLAVFYISQGRNSRVAGGGWINRAWD